MDRATSNVVTAILLVPVMMAPRFIRRSGLRAGIFIDIALYEHVAAVKPREAVPNGGGL